MRVYQMLQREQHNASHSFIQFHHAPKPNSQPHTNTVFGQAHPNKASHLISVDFPATIGDRSKRSFLLFSLGAGSRTVHTSFFPLPSTFFFDTMSDQSPSSSSATPKANEAPAPLPAQTTKPAKKKAAAASSSRHSLGRIGAQVAINVGGFVVVGAGLLISYAAFTAKIGSAMEAASSPEQAAFFMPMLRPHIGPDSIKYLNSTHVYLMALIAAALALLTAVDALLELCVEYVADRALISTSLVAEMETGDYDLAITNAGFSKRTALRAAPPKKK